MLKRTTKPLRRRVLTEEDPAKSSKKQHSENTDKWHLWKAGSFSYGESPWTPPLEGTSLHRWNKKVYAPPPPPHPLPPKEALRIKGAWWNAEQNYNNNS